jgi:DNA repair protein RecN (Recombination protein N)
MVVSGLALLFGGRADSSRLRPGVESASVEGRLMLGADSSTGAIVTAAGGDIEDDGSLVLRRVVTANGRSRAAAGGASVPASVLSRLADELLAVHGQSDQQRLTQPAKQRLTLDRYAGVDLTDCKSGFDRWRSAAAELDRRLTDARELAREAELLRHGIAEIAAVAPQPGEDDELAALAGRLEYADALRQAARAAHDALLGDADDPTGDAADVQSLLGLARRGLQQIAGTDAELDRLTSRITDLVATATDLGAELADYEAQLDADPERLAAVNERRHVLNGLLRKYGPDLDAVLAWSVDAQQRLAASDTSDGALAALTALRDQAAADYLAAAELVSKQRREAADDLSARVTEELAGLAMPNATVRVVVRLRSASESSPTVTIDDARVGAGPDGVDEVELALRSHPDAPELPVQRGASGGELSRVMLAIEVVLAGTDPVPTMVFDEVDAGVGGRAAVEIGRRLARLARSHQVIVVTHLAQVAAFADRHLVVDKSVGSTDGVTRSDIRSIAGEHREAELARMLAGDVSPIALKHAAELLAAAAHDAAEAPRQSKTRASKR